MHKILMNLFTGNIRPAEMKPSTCPLHQFYKKVYAELEKQLCSSLNEEESELLAKLLEAKNAVNAYGDTDTFINGFQLGALMMVDVFRDEDNLLDNTEQYLRRLIHRPYHGTEI